MDFLRSLFSFLRIFPASSVSVVAGGSGSKPWNGLVITLRVPGGGRSGLVHGSTVVASSIGLPGAASHLYGVATGECPLGSLLQVAGSCKIDHCSRQTLGFQVAVTAASREHSRRKSRAIGQNDTEVEPKKTLELTSERLA